MVEPAPEPSEQVDSDPAVGHWQPAKPQQNEQKVREIGGRKDGSDPTRYGDWEKNGRCIDF